MQTWNINRVQILYALFHAVWLTSITFLNLSIYYILTCNIMFRFVQTSNVLRHCRCVAEYAVNAANFQGNAVFLYTSQTLYRRRKINDTNPGLDRRLNLFKENDDNSVGNRPDLIDEDNMQDDFMNTNERSANYNNDRQADQDRDLLKRHIVKQKYFKSENQPNFLTWAEKEQIRQLHSSDEVEWSSEKLSQSFPAPETVIKKILKSRWAQEDLNKISRHDKSVQRHWKDLLRGKLEIDHQLKEHLMKFAKRSQAGLAHNFLENSNYCENLLVPVENEQGEFSRMVKSCRGETGSGRQLKLPAGAGRHEKIVEDSEVRSYSSDSDTFVLDPTNRPRKTTEIITLDLYKQAFNLGGVQVEEDDVLEIAPWPAEQKHAGLKPTVKESNLIPGTEKLGTSIHMKYPERITIPESKWVEGGTYKAGDCYYDDDGEFLYRVPGMK